MKSTARLFGFLAAAAWSIPIFAAGGGGPGNNNFQSQPFPGGGVQIVPGGFQGGPGGPGGFQNGAMNQGGPGGAGGRGGAGMGPGGPGMNAGGANVAGLQSVLQATNEEWKVIGPILERVVSDVQLLDAADSGALAGNAGATGGGPMGRGGPGGGGNDAFGGPASVASGGRGGPGGRGGRGGFQGGPEGMANGPGFAGGPGGPAQDPNWAGGAAPGGGVTLIIGGGPGMGAAVNNSPAPDLAAAAPAPGAATPAPGPAVAAPSTGTPTSTAAATGPAVGDSGVSAKTMTLAQAMTDLQTLLADPNATEEQLKEHIAIVHDARAKTKADLEDARKDLLLLLTTDQEAALVGLGYLP